MSIKERACIQYLITKASSIWRLRRDLIRANLALFACTALILSTAPAFSQAQRQGRPGPAAPLNEAQEQDINSLLADYETLTLDLKETAREVESKGRFTIKIRGVKYDLELEPNNLLAPGFQAFITTDSGVIDETQLQVTTYRGRVVGDDESDVRLLIQDDMMFGYIRTGEDWVFIDPLRKYKRDAQPDQLVAYRDADVRPEAQGTCGSAGLKNQAAELLKESRLPEANLVAAPTPEAAVTSSPRIVEVATDADFEFFQANGANSNTVIQGVINQVDGIYLRELYLTLRITFQNVFATATDPYTSTNASTLLNEFRNTWNANRTTVQRDVAHLFTGKNLDGATVGIAFVRDPDNLNDTQRGVVCRVPTAVYGLSQQLASNFAKLVAHEIAHNFSAAHDDQLNPPTATCNGAGPIMCSSIQANGPSQFSQRSRDDIATYINTFGNCLEGASGLWVGTTNGGNNGFNTGIWAIQSTSTSMKTFAGDFNGDGIADVLKIDASNNCTGGLWVGISDGTKYTFSQWATWCTPTSIKVLTGDFNGDGYTDVMKFDQSTNCTGGLWVGLSNGVNAFNTSRWATWCTSPDIKVLAGDFNGDGKDDVMKFDVPSSGISQLGLWVGISNGTSFTASRWATWDTYRDMKVLAGDFNGDGKTDVMKFDVPSSGISQLGLWVGLSTGSSFNGTRWATWDTYRDMKVLAGDFNGDGKDDVMKFDVPSSGISQLGLWVGLSNGSSFAGSRWATWDTYRDMKVLA
ncbi:MAG TPA: M12 family metallo-peptidase, partial [Blastocatellia bacterium]|nr:M12 family metallo-peptidase [Blastocatellia bacterium]